MLPQRIPTNESLDVCSNDLYEEDPNEPLISSIGNAVGKVAGDTWAGRKEAGHFLFQVQSLFAFPRG